MNVQEEITHQDIIAQMNLLLVSREFSKSTRLKELLSYLVSEHINGTTQISSRIIAKQVFQHTGDFNASSNSIVRVNVKRLREKLKEYYIQSESQDILHFALKDRGYDLTFTKLTPPYRPLALRIVDKIGRRVIKMIKNQVSKGMNSSYF